ncbi:type II toxin-antitoxin system HicA family toxin [Methanocella paludicola]|uniref:type II toxin-antitoxin system HicA family toxin n=1 Tax=Methanocella paludicola TaxID=570267 RepID=UPI000FFB88F6|nr:type II toxin-antitoxin system HicA family toxin [Methanocella paludicola]
MPRLPVVSWKDIIKLLRKLGYNFKRQGKRDHIIYSIDSPRVGLGIVSIPRHDEIDPGTLRSILDIVSDNTGLTTNDLIEMLR